MFKKIILSVALFGLLLSFPVGEAEALSDSQKIERLEVIVSYLLEVIEDEEMLKALNLLADKIEGWKEAATKEEKTLGDFDRLMKKMESFDYYGMSLDFSLKGMEDIKEISLKGDFKVDQAREDFMGDLVLEVTGDMESFIGVPMDASVEVGGEIVFKDKDLYLKIKEIPAILLLMMSEQEKEDVLMYTNKWLFFPSETIEGAAQDEVGNEEMEMIKMGVERIIEKDVLVLENKGIEFVNGRVATKYKVNLDEESLYNFLVNDWVDIIKIMDEGFEGITQAEREEAREMVKAAVEWFDEKISFNIYMDDNYIYRTSLSISFDEDDLRALFSFMAPAVEDDFLTLSIEFDYYDFNKSFNITTPPKEVDMGELQREREREFSDIVIQNQMGQIRSLAEALYTFDGYYSDFANIKERDDYYTLNYTRVADEIDNMGSDTGLVTNFSDDNRDYCAYAQLVKDNKNAFCVDSTGNAAIGLLTEVSLSCGRDVLCK